LILFPEDAALLPVVGFLLPPVFFLVAMRVSLLPA